MSDDSNPLLQSIRYLYEGRQSQLGMPIAEQAQFHDPLVIVHGRDRILSMFKKLNRLYPATTVERFDGVDVQSHQYELIVHYRRREASKPTAFHSRIEFTLVDGEIMTIIEDWQKPFSRSGRSERAMSQWVRRSLGRLLS